MKDAPEILVHNGKLFEDVMARSCVTHHELQAALRAAGCATVEEVHAAILENNGEIKASAWPTGEGASSAAMNKKARR